MDHMLKASFTPILSAIDDVVLGVEDGSEAVVASFGATIAYLIGSCRASKPIP